VQSGFLNKFCIRHVLLFLKCILEMMRFGKAVDLIGFYYGEFKQFDEQGINALECCF